MTATDTMIEPTHPSWLEKKANAPEHRQVNRDWLYRSRLTGVRRLAASTAKSWHSGC